MEYCDRIIIGAGFYGLYAAYFCAKRGLKVLVLECGQEAFQRATYINQARVHQGYHYPRSISTAIKSAGYFERFNKDYGFCINREFQKVYATSSQFSWSDREQFLEFCKASGIPCEELYPETFFKPGMCDGAFLVREYTYDAMALKTYLLEQLSGYKNVRIQYGVRLMQIEQSGDSYVLYINDGKRYRTGFLMNAAYASVNQILNIAGYEKFKIKYELCEIILCDADDRLRDYGFTVMDGPFFSIMPFGKTGYHSLTSVTFTPHSTSYEELPEFLCQKESGGYCSRAYLGNCNECPAKPDTAFPYMEMLAKKYLREEYGFHYKRSLYSMKPILMSSELDDSRPTVIQVHSHNPVFISVLSGKINTVYDLDEVLCDGR